MKTYNKIIIVAVIIGVLISGGLYAYIMNVLNDFEEEGVNKAELNEKILYEKEDIQDGSNNNDDSNDTEEEEQLRQEELEKEKEREKREKEERKRKEKLDAYLKIINSSDRINVLCLGIADGLADTMVVASFDSKKKLLDLIFIPRDTYHHREGYDRPGQKKINASFIGRNLVARAQSSMNSVRDILNIPIHDFVKVEYEGVEKVIDNIGGVEVYIPFDMDYDDPASDLHIQFKEGKQLLDGEKSVEFLRFRKNNDNTHSDGDIGRINRQKEFIMSAIDKCLGLDTLKVVNTAKNYVKTSMSPNEMINNAIKFNSIKENNINVYVLPGVAKYKEGLSFYIYDKDKVMELMTNIYKR